MNTFVTEKKQLLANVNYLSQKTTYSKQWSTDHTSNFPMLFRTILRSVIFVLVFRFIYK